MSGAGSIGTGHVGLHAHTVTCTQRDAGFITERQKRDATKLLCTGMASLRASVQLKLHRISKRQHGLAPNMNNTCKSSEARQGTKY
jgi:hypothetical protein